MNFCFIAIGKPHDLYVKTGVETFTNRIAKYYDVKWKIIAPVKNAALLSAQELKKKEAEAIQKIIQKDDYLIALDEKGKSFTSMQFAQFLQERANISTKQILFLIGGAFGLDNSILQSADEKLTLSTFTFPHQLVRLILAEQIYRACTIMRNEKYHHS